jgi:hypothetical protein
MAIQIRRAERRKARLRLALMGPTGSGKTMSALRLAFGIGGKVGIIDTENGSADLYADAGDYDVITLEKPYTVASYREAIAAFEDAKYDVIIIDSLSHAWAGSGGLLDKSGQAQKKGANSFTAWREITPEHNALVEAMLTSPAHIIATMRVKMEYVLETNDKGKQVPRKIGLQPVQRDGLEYEFTLVMDIDESHKASASKDRTRLFDGWYDQITERTGAKLREWLESGVDAPPPPNPDEQLATRIKVALAKASDMEAFQRIASHPDAIRLMHLISADVQAAQDRIAIDDDTDWTIGSKEAAE